MSLGAATLFAAGLLSGLALQQVSIGVLLFALGIVLFAARGYLEAGALQQVSIGVLLFALGRHRTLRRARLSRRRDKAVTGALIFVALVAVGIQIVVHFLGP